MRPLLLKMFKALSLGAVAVFMAGWVAAFLAQPPPPRWLIPTMLTAIGVAMVAGLLYHIANRSFTEPIESLDWEIETPTTVRNLVRQNWAGPLFVWIILSVTAISVLRDRPGVSTPAAVAAGLLIGTALSGVFVFLHARGWIRDE